MFLKKVPQFDSLMASPKHPQSDTGLKIAITNVSGVKKAINRNAPQAAVLIFTPNKSSKPISSSAAQAATERYRAKGFKKSKLNAIK
jgi:hypothetical protein